MIRFFSLGHLENVVEILIERGKKKDLVSVVIEDVF